METKSARKICSEMNFPRTLGRASRAPSRRAASGSCCVWLAPVAAILWASGEAVTFTPCFLWIFLGAPFVEAMRGNRALAGALSAVTAAVVGVVLNLAIWFAIHTTFRHVQPVRFQGVGFEAPVLTSIDPWAFGLSVAAAIAIFRFKIGMLPILATSSFAGILLYLIGAVA